MLFSQKRKEIRFTAPGSMGFIACFSVILITIQRFKWMHSVERFASMYFMLGFFFFCFILFSEVASISGSVDDVLEDDFN